MDCPTFQAGNIERADELKPYSCPLIYCGPRPGVQNSGNFTFSICVKGVNEMNPERYRNIDKLCVSDYNICESNCQSLKGESISPFLNNTYFFGNATKYTAVGCTEGDYSGVKNKSSVFPLSSIVQTKFDPEVPKGIVPESSANQLHTSMMVPWLLMVALFTIYFAKKF